MGIAGQREETDSRQYREYRDDDDEFAKRKSADFPEDRPLFPLRSDCVRHVSNIGDKLCRRIDLSSHGSFLGEFQFALLRTRLRLLYPSYGVRMALLRLFHFRAFRAGRLAVLLGLLRFPLAVRVVYGIEVFLRLDSHIGKNEVANLRFIVPGCRYCRQST